MRGKRFGRLVGLPKERLVGLPKEIVIAMLGVAIMATFAVDLTGSHPAAALPAPTIAFRPSDKPPAPTTTVPPTTIPAPTTTMAPAGVPAPTTSPPRHITSTVVVKKAPSPVKPSPVAAGGPRASQTIPFGAYVSSGDPSGLAAFGGSTGTHPTYAADYLPRNEGWPGISNDGTVSWLTNQWRGHGYTLILGVPIIPTDASGNPQGTLAGGAAGQYNSYFVTLAQSLVSGGAPNAVLRLGWEFTGNWYPWQVTNATDAANFAAYFRNIVTSMRSVPGQSFKFVWNPNAGNSFGNTYTPEQAYPGSAYVDYVGIDVYDQGWSSPATPQNAWANQLSQSWGLNWLSSFAAEVGRPIVFPEWGVEIRSDGHGMGDDPYFINQFAAWIVQHNVAWTAYFEYDTADASCSLLDGQFASSLAAFRADFG